MFQVDGVVRTSGLISVPNWGENGYLVTLLIQLEQKDPTTFVWLINQLSPLTLVTTRVNFTRGLLCYLIMVQ